MPEIDAAARRRVLAAVCGATFVAFLDATVANLAIPALQEDFDGASVTTLSWVITLYAIGFAALLSPAGRLADAMGRRRVFVAGVATFTLASAAAAAAPSLAVLFVARAVQGLGAAAMIPASLGIILAHTPVERRAQAIGMWAAAASAAAAFGPSLGGVLVEGLSWRWLFLINVPLGLAILAAARSIPRGEPTSETRPDLPGTAVLAAGLGLLVLGIAQGGTWGWGDARTLVALAGGLALVAATLARSRTHPAPAVEIALWRIRPYAAANGASLLFGVLLYPWLLGGVLFLTQIWGYTELEAGLAVSPGAVVAAAVGLVLGRLGRPEVARPAAIGGSLLCAAVAAAMFVWLPDDPRFLTVWLPAGLVVGCGMGAVAFGLTTGAALSVPATHFAGATGLNQTVRQLGGGLGVAGLAALLEASPPPGTGGFDAVWAMCGVASLLGAVVALGFAGRAAAHDAPAAEGGALAAEGRA